MKRLLMGLFCVLLSGATLAAGPAAVRKQVQASMLLTGKIVVAPDGNVRSYVIDQVGKVPPAVVAMIANNVPKWKFEPTLLDGKPVAAEAKMSFRVVARPVGEEKFSIGISGAEFGQGNPGDSITYKSMIKPIYPIQASRSHATGTVYLLLRVGQQGQVTDVVAEQVNMTVVDSDVQLEKWREILARAAMSAARKWTFNTPTSGSAVHDDHWVASVPVRFSIQVAGASDDDAYGLWQAYVPGPRQPIPWFEKGKMVSDSADAASDGTLNQLGQGLRLTAPLHGA